MAGLATMTLDSVRREARRILPREMMMHIPYWYRVFALLVLAAVMVAYDRRKGHTERQWEYGCLLLSGIVGAVYAAANDAVTVSLSPDYFEALRGRVSTFHK